MFGVKWKLVFPAYSDMKFYMYECEEWEDIPINTNQQSSHTGSESPSLCAPAAVSMPAYIDQCSAVPACSATARALF